MDTLIKAYRWRASRYTFTGLLVVLLAFGAWQTNIQKAWASDGRANLAPEFKVDPSWPKALPNNWLLGQVGGIAVDQYDNVWIIQRPRSLTSDEAGATDAYIDTDGDGIADADPYGNSRPAGPIADCCFPAPSVMQFDKRGNLLRAWGGPAAHDPQWKWLKSEGNEYAPTEFVCDPMHPGNPCEWPATEHGIYVDHNDYVYIAGNGFGDGSPGSNNRGWDGMVLKFAMDGTFIMQVGIAGRTAADSNDTGSGVNGTPALWRPADMEVDPMTNELYIADGYGNHRIVVVDAGTGMYKRHWGAYGQRPVNDAESDAMGGNAAGNPIPGYPTTDPELVAPPHFRNPVHAIRISNDGLAYVADRANNRLQVFDKLAAGSTDCMPGGPGTCGFVAEKFIERDTLGPGSVWDLDVSPDRWQTYLYSPDGTNQYVWSLERMTLDILGRFGGSGRNAGQFHWVHNIALDSRGTMYTAEVDTGKRVQKFDRRGARTAR